MSELSGDDADVHAFGAELRDSTKEAGRVNRHAPRAEPHWGHRCVTANMPAP